MPREILDRIDATREPRRSRRDRREDDAAATARDYWAALLAGAGAVATLAGLVYFVGAVSLWIALHNRGFSEDVAIRHQPRTEIITIGLRGALAVALISSFLLLASYLLIRIPGMRERARSLSLRGAVVVSLLLLLAAAFVSWRWVAVALTASTLLLAVALHESWRRRYWVAVLGVAMLTSLAWVAGGPVKVRAVIVSPASAAPIEPRFLEHLCESGSSRYAEVGGERIADRQRNDCGLEPELSAAAIKRRLQQDCSVPYFGETESFVYLGETRAVHQAADGRCTYGSGLLVEIPRDEVTLSFLASKGNLNPSLKRPIEAIWEGVHGYLSGLDARLQPEGAE